MTGQVTNRRVGTAVFIIVLISGTLLFISFIASQAVALFDAGSGNHRLFIPVMQKPPDVFRVTPISSAFHLPTFITNAGDERLFVLEKPGVIKILHPDGQITTFLDIQDRVLNGTEQGLFNLIFDPNYAANGYFYVSYIGWWGEDREDYHFYVSRFEASGNAANPLSECRFYNQFMDNQIHSGGGMAYRDGLLYVGIGDDQGLLAAQEHNTDKGKIVTLSLAQLDNGCHYQDGQQISKGLRNPWRFDFDPLNGNMYIGDVNDNSWEEINFIPHGYLGTNFGWPCMEGPVFIGFPIQAQCESVGQGDLPIYYYPHHPHCAVIGGYVLRPTPQAPAEFIFGDACTREIFRLTHTDPVQVEMLGVLTNGGFMLTSFGRGYDGTLYAAEFPNTIYEIHIPTQD